MRRFQWLCELEDVPDWMPYSSAIPVPRGHFGDWNSVLHIGGKTGQLYAERGDWVIMDSNGDLSVMTETAMKEYQESDLARLARPPAPDGDVTNVGGSAASLASSREA